MLQTGLADGCSWETVLGEAASVAGPAPEVGFHFLPVMITWLTGCPPLL